MEYDDIPSLTLISPSWLKKDQQLQTVVVQHIKYLSWPFTAVLSCMWLASDFVATGLKGGKRTTLLPERTGEM